MPQVPVYQGVRFPVVPVPWRWEGIAGIVVPALTGEGTIHSRPSQHDIFQVADQHQKRQRARLKASSPSFPPRRDTDKRERCGQLELHFACIFL